MPSGHLSRTALAPSTQPFTQLPPTAYLAMFGVSVGIALLISLILPELGIAAKWGGTGHDGYLELAASLHAGTGFRFSADGPPVFHRPPLYPALLAPVMGFGVPVQKIYVALLNSVFFTVACLYTVRSVQLLYRHPAIGVVAVVLLMANPWIYRLISSPLSAVMQMSLYTALCFNVLKLVIDCDRITALPARTLAIHIARLSLLTSALCYSHGTSIYVCSALLFFTLTFTIATGRWRLTLMTTLLACLTVMALAPWAARNEALLGRAEPVTSGAGYTYFLGNIYWNIDNTAHHGNRDRNAVSLISGGVTEPSSDMVSHWGVVDPAVDGQMREAMVSHIAENPVEVLTKSLLNLGDIFFPITHVAWCAAGGVSEYCAETMAPYQLGQRVLRSLYCALLIGFAVFSVFAGSRAAWWLPGLTLCCAGLYSVPYLPIATYAHHGIYSLGALPLLSALAAAALVSLVRRRQAVTVAL